MAIVNQFPGGGGVELSIGYIPITIKPLSEDDVVNRSCLLILDNETILYMMSVPTIETTQSTGLKFTALDDFTGKYKTTSSSTYAQYNFKKGQEYTICYYKSSSRYHYKLYEGTTEIFNSGMTSINYWSQRLLYFL